MKLTISIQLGRRRRERPETPVGYTARTGVPVEGQTVEQTTAALGRYARDHMPEVKLAGR